MIVDIPDELAERVRTHRDYHITRGAFCLQCDLAALLPEPDPLDVLAAEDGWERTHYMISCAITDQVSVYMRIMDEGPTLCAYHEGHTLTPAAAVALARNLRTALEQAGVMT